MNKILISSEFKYRGEINQYMNRILSIFEKTNQFQQASYH